VTLPPKPRRFHPSTSAMAAVAALAIAAALVSGIRASRSAHREDRPTRIAGEERRGGSHPAIPIPPVPPTAPDLPNLPESGNSFDRDRFERQLKEQLKSMVPRAGTLGLIAGARALEKTNRPERAAAMLRRSKDPIARLELFLLERQWHPATAKPTLAKFAASVPPDEWPAPLLRAYLGEATDDQVLAAATDEDETCDANYYLGRLHAPTDPARARKELGLAASEDCGHSAFAREELQSLQSR
jgi:hypothetical protein